LAPGNYYKPIIKSPVGTEPSMRFHLYILLLSGFVVFSFNSGLTACPAEDIVFQTQKQIDDFAKKHSHCTAIKGNVQIGSSHLSSDIVDLTPLRSIHIVHGHLNIINNPLLTDLHGLSNLTSIGGYLNIFKNDRLNNLDHLSGLESIDGSLWIIRNSSLHSLNGLRNLTSINGSLDVSFNSSLASLEGLESIDPRSISTTPTYLLTPIIDVHILENAPTSEVKLPNLTTFRERNSPANRFRALAHEPYSERAVETDFLYKEMDHLDDSKVADTILKNLSDVASASGDNLLVWESEFLKHYHRLM